MKAEITNEEMIKAINESGYLIEQRVARKFEEASYSVVPNQIFVDPITNVRREIDLVAIKIDNKLDNHDFFGYEIICECENNLIPIVFFPHKFNKHGYVSELKCSGFKSMWELFRSMSDDLIIDNTILTTQYCAFNFVKPKDQTEKKWMALHTNEQHDTLDKLKKSVQHRKKKFEPFIVEPDIIEGRIHFPLLVLRNHLYIWNETNGNQQLERINHIIYKAQDFNEESNFYEEYYIDVVVEDYLPEYIKHKNSEWEFYSNIIIGNRTSILEDQIRRNIISKSI